MKGESYVKGKQRVVEACLDSLLLSGYKHSWSAYPLGPTKMERVCRSPNFALTHTHKEVCGGVVYLGGKLEGFHKDFHSKGLWVFLVQEEVISCHVPITVSYSWL